jgi:hypothetical protein
VHDPVRRPWLMPAALLGLPRNVAGRPSALPSTVPSRPTTPSKASLTSVRKVDEAAQPALWYATLREHELVSYASATLATARATMAFRCENDFIARGLSRFAWGTRGCGVILVPISKYKVVILTLPVFPSKWGCGLYLAG